MLCIRVRSISTLIIEASFLLAVGRQSAELLFGGPPLGSHGGGMSARSGGPWSTGGEGKFTTQTDLLCHVPKSIRSKTASKTAPTMAEMRSAVLKALASDFHGMTRDQIAKHVGLQLDVVIHPKNDLGRTFLLPSMRDAGLISMDKRTWHLTEAGRRAIAEEPQEKSQVICFAYYLLSRSCPDHFLCPGR